MRPSRHTNRARRWSGKGQRLHYDYSPVEQRKVEQERSCPTWGDALVYLTAANFVEAVLPAASKTAMYTPDAGARKPTVWLPAARVE
jgi:hypothetical protein